MNSRPYGFLFDSIIACQYLGHLLECFTYSKVAIANLIIGQKRLMSKSVRHKKVISASRRVDLVAFYPDYMVERLEEIGPKNIHTLVIWTKNPQNMLENRRLRSILEKMSQVYVLLTVTGLGGTPLEPNAPKQDQVFPQLHQVIDFIGSPQRLAVRYDPLIDVIHQGKDRITNINVYLFEQVLSSAHLLGIKRIIVSYVTVYAKVKKRLAQNGFQMVDHPIEEMIDFIKNQMMPRTEKRGMELSTCVLPNLTTIGCIDGETLIRLHPSNELCSLGKDRSQRDACHCTKSTDIGQWFACYHNCLYCYGNPTGKSENLS
jgi:DNA repair photolyase